MRGQTVTRPERLTNSTSLNPASFSLNVSTLILPLPAGIVMEGQKLDAEIVSIVIMWLKCRDVGHSKKNMPRIQLAGNI